MLNQIISSRAKRKILTLLLTNPKKKFYVREISRMVDENINSARKELSKLTAAGLVSSEKEANLLLVLMGEKAACRRVFNEINWSLYSNKDFASIEHKAKGLCNDFLQEAND